jgi:hypothetical protein
MIIDVADDVVPKTLLRDRRRRRERCPAICRLRSRCATHRSSISRAHRWKTDYHRALWHNDLLRRDVLVIRLQRTISLIHEKGFIMNKYLSILTAALVLGTVSAAAARTVTRYHAAAASVTSTAESFQSNWNVSY